MGLTQAKLTGLAFPTARVSCARPTDHHGSRYFARMRHDSEHVYHARAAYHYDLSPAENALRAARLVHAKALADTDGGSTDEYLAIPGDLDASSYVFVFVPKHLFES